MDFVLIKFLYSFNGQRKKHDIKSKKDWSLIIFWFSIYTYCICGLIKLIIINDLPLYGIFAFLLFIMSIALSVIDVRR